MIIKIPFVQNHALTSEDNVEYTWAEISLNPILPKGTKDMPCVNLLTKFPLINNTAVIIGNEYSRDTTDVHRRILDIYKELFDNDMQINYKDLDIKNRFIMWIHHVDDGWKQKGNIFNDNKPVWNLNAWKKFSEEILPNLI